MKTAILITGHMRTFDRCLPTQAWHVYRHFPGADFYVSTVQDADAPKAELLHRHYPAAHVSIDIVEAQPDLPIPTDPVDPNWQLGAVYGHEPYALSVPPLAVLRQLWQLDHAWWHFTTAGNPEDYDLIIRARPDSYFHSFTPPGQPIPADEAHTPWWGRFGGINDRFALLGSQTAPHYFQTYRNLAALLESGCPLHPESLVKASLLSQPYNYLYDTLRAEFSTLKHESARPPEITPIDLAHAALA